MKDQIMHRIKRRIAPAIALCTALLLQMPLMAQQRWDIPQDKKDKKSYIRFNDTTAREGQVIYTANCQSCHGDPGKGNSLKTLNPVPPDLASALTQKLTDGELFWILTNGRLLMPSFKVALSDEQRWTVISFIRSFNKNYVQEISKINPAISKLVKVKLEFDSVKNKIRVQVSATEKSGIVILHDAEVTLFAKRYFGKLQIDKATRTNQQGLAEFVFPKDLPGDKEGNVDLTVKVNDEYYGEIEHETRLDIGVPTDKPSLTEKRAIWNVLNKAPYWIIITFTSVVLAVGAVLMLILRNLMKIRKSVNN